MRFLSRAAFAWLCFLAPSVISSRGPYREHRGNHRHEPQYGTYGDMTRGRALSEAFLEGHPQCRAEVQRPAVHFAWDPEPDRYLVMLCFRNQVSNLLRCMHNHLLLSALLNRTLLIPPSIPFSGRHPHLPPEWQDPSHPSHLTFDLRVLWDLKHTEQCLGAGRVKTLEEMTGRSKGRKVKVDVIHCWHGNQLVCEYYDEAKLNCPARTVVLNPSISLPGGRQKLNPDAKPTLVPDPGYFQGRLSQLDLDAMNRSAAASAACLPHNATMDAVMHAYRGPNSAAKNARVLVVGDLVNMKVEDPFGLLFADQGKVLGHDPFLRLPGCANRLLIQPARSIIDRAWHLVSEMFGPFPFVAVHWRRGDFLWYCNTQGHLHGHCTYAAPQAASCLEGVLRTHNVSRVFIATNAPPAEVILFKRALQSLSPSELHIYSRALNKEQPAPWLNGLSKDLGIAVRAQRDLIETTLDKVICAHAAIFVGSGESTFSQDIKRMRIGLGKDSACDALLCEGEQEWDEDHLYREAKKLRVQ